MKKNKLFQIFGLLFLMWLLLMVKFLMSEFSYDAIIMATFNIIILTIQMMIIPLICRIVNRDRLDINKGNAICKWNSIGVYIITIIFIIVILDGRTSNIVVDGLGAIIFYYINKWLFVYDKDMLIIKRKLKLKKEIEDNYNKIMGEPLKDLLEVEKRKNKYIN